MKKKRILLVDEDELFRLWVRDILEQEEDMEIVGDCKSAEEALPQVETLSPNIVVMDVCLPGMSGVEACQQLTESRHACDVIMLTREQDMIDDALNAGAVGYFPKDIKKRGLVEAIKLAYKWQSLKAKLDSSICTVSEIETMVIECMDKLAVKQIYEEDTSEWLSSEGNGADIVAEVTLVISSSSDGSQLCRFIGQVEEVFQASVLETVGCWNDTCVTFRLRRPVPVKYILDELMKMPEVAEAEEKISRGRRFSKKGKDMPRKQVSVTLVEQVQPLITAGQRDQYFEMPKLQPQVVGVAAGQPA